jgi:hypothetical protein
VDITGCQVLNARIRGIELIDTTIARVANCTLRGRANDKNYRAGLSVGANCTRVMVTNNFLGRGSDGDFQLPAKAGTASGNVML